jgi:opacity protein-like surface antigen
VLGAGAGRAEEYKVGGHLGYTAGGNVAHNSFGFGAHGSARVNDALSIELAGSYFTEDNKNVNGGVTAIALTGRVGKSVGEGARLYLGAGPDASIFAWSDLDPAVGYHFCAGSDLRLGRGLEFMAEYRFSVVTVSSTDADSFRYNYGLVRLGLSYTL